MPMCVRNGWYRRAMTVALLATGSVSIGEVVAQTAVPNGEQQLASGPMFLMAQPKTAGSSERVWRDARDLAVLRQRVSVTFRDIPLRVALDSLGRMARLKITYSSGVIRSNAPVTLQAMDITVGAALSGLLFGAGVDVLLTPSGQAAIVKRGSIAALVGGVTGQITDAKTGASVPGVEVFLEKTRWRTTTDTAGRYSMLDVELGSYTLVTRRFGYQKKSQALVIQDDSVETIDVALEPVALALNELVTTATGKQRRRDLGNSITTIKADSILQTAPIRNLTDLLDGRVPGLSVQRTSGAPGDPARLRLRGIGSVLRGNDPVVIVDGIRVYSAQSESRSGNLTNLGDDNAFSSGGGSAATSNPRQTSMQNLSTPAPSPLDQIDPNIIETIDVFKGPSAATLYGADAANGVIVITTKRGKPGPTRWDVRFNYGRTDTPGKWPEAYFNWGHNSHTGAPLFCTLTNPSCVPDSLVRYQALNDPNATMLSTGQRTAASLTASGGSQTLTYSVTGSYSDETGLLTLPGIEAERYRARFNRDVPDWMQRPHHLENWQVSSNVTARLGATAEVTLTASLNRMEQQRSTLEQQVSALAGTYVDQVNRRYYSGGSQYLTASTKDFLSSYYTRTTSSSFNFTTGLRTNWRPRSWFETTLQTGVNVIPRSDETYLPAEMISPIDSGALILGTGRSIEGSFDWQGSVRKPMRWGLMFQTRFGANLTTRNTDQVATTGAQLVPGKSTLSGARLIKATSGAANSSVFGWYIEPTITGQRFTLSTGLRLDGGSNYGTRLSGSAGAGLLALPKLQGSWVISEEPFFPFKSFFSSLQLRGSYGQAQQQPGPQDRLRLYTRMKDVGSGTTDRLILTDLGNTELRPERATEVDVGFNAEILDSRVGLDVSLYRKMTVDALMIMGLPLSVNGGGNVYQNIGNVLNKGIDFTVNVTSIRSTTLTWSMAANYSHNSNKLVKIGSGVALNRELGIVEGYPLYGRWSRPILGYGDANGNGILEASEVQIGDSLLYMGQTMPNHTSSLSSNMSLFGGMFRITADFSYTAGGTQVDESARKNWVLSRPLIDATSPAGDRAAALAFDSTTYGLTQSIATFRFNSLSINYRAPTSITRLLRAAQMTIGVQGSNIGLHSTYRGKDPNVSAWTPGETITDTGQLPQPRTWNLSVQLIY